MIDRHQTLMWEVGDLMSRWEASSLRRTSPPPGTLSGQDASITAGCRLGRSDRRRIFPSKTLITNSSCDYDFVIIVRGAIILTN